MKIVFKNTSLEFQKYNLYILDHRENVTITNGATSQASNINTIVGNKYGAIVRVKNVTKPTGGTDPLFYLYEGSGTPRLGTSYKKSSSPLDYYIINGTATTIGKIGGSCSSEYTITYDIILFDLTAHPEYEQYIPYMSFDEISSLII